jgi:hypothetical protein
MALWQGTKVDAVRKQSTGVVLAAAEHPFERTAGDQGQIALVLLLFVYPFTRPPLNLALAGRAATRKDIGSSVGSVSSGDSHLARTLIHSVVERRTLCRKQSSGMFVFISIGRLKVCHQLYSRRTRYNSAS